MSATTSCTVKLPTLRAWYERRRSCPTSGIVGNVIQQMIVAQWAEEMIGRGSVPTFMRGVYQTGGPDNEAMLPVFERRGY